MQNLRSSLRNFSWFGLLICFFLPFCRGCNNAPFVPAEAAFKNPAAFLFAGTPFLYPLLILLGWFIAKKFSRAAKSLYGVNLALILGFGTLILYFTFFEKNIGKNFEPWEILVAVAVVLLIAWSIATFVGKKANLLNAAAFQQSAMSLIWIASNIFWNNDILYGGWLSLGLAATATLLAFPWR